MATSGSIDFTFSRDTDEVRTLQEYLNPLPRSVIRDNAYELLDGEWQFALDPEDRGLHEHWYLRPLVGDAAQWPGSIEDHLATAQGAERLHGKAWHDTVVAWYERTFIVPESWLHVPSGSVQVTFGACGYETRVWLNGHRLTTVEGEEVHTGGYTSFSYELPNMYLRSADNRLTVRITSSMDAEIPRGKQESRVYQQGGIWYQTISGSVRSVWIEPVERNRLRSRLTVVSHIETGLVECALTTLVHDPGLYTLRLVIGLRDTSKPAVTQEFTLPLEEGEKRQWVTLVIPNPQLWSPAQPQLYYLIAQLMGPDGVSSQITGHFGLRQLGRRGHRIYLNGEPIYFDGMLYQPGTATFDEMRSHMRAMKALGCNLVRVHIAGIDPRLYDLADEMGMLLWVEVPSPHVSSQRSRANHGAELQRMLVTIGSHPSIIVCSLYNEDWGAQDIATNAETRAYIAATYDYVRMNYPTLLVVDNDGWNHVSREGRLTSDLLTVHMYTPDREIWAKRLARLTEGGNHGVAVEPLVVGDPFFYAGQIPLIVSEWGGFGYTEYGGPEDPATKAERIRAFKRELRRHAISGDVYTQATSIEQEVNGVIDPHTGELLVPPGLFSTTPSTDDA